MSLFRFPSLCFARWEERIVVVFFLHTLEKVQLEEIW